MSLEAICAETKISRRILESLESGSFERLPERIFSRSFVNQYAAAIGGAAPSLLDDFDSAWERYEQESGEFAIAKVPEPPPRPYIRWGFWFPMSVGVVILTLAAVVILSGSEPGQEALMESSRSLTTTSSAPRVTPTRAARVPPTIAEPESSEVEKGVVVLAIEVDEKKECWIRYRDHEGHTDQRLLAGGTRLRLELEGPVKLTIGDAGAATLEVGGLEYAGLGVPGQVVHTEVSRDGVRTLGSGDRND